MTAPILGNLRVDSPEAIARAVVRRLGRLGIAGEQVAYLVADRHGTVQLILPAMRHAEITLQVRARDLVGAYTRCVASQAIVDLIAGDLTEVLK